MDEADPDNMDVIDLVIQLCPRIGMMIEDVCPLALDASREALEEWVADLQGALRVMATITDAADAVQKS